MTTPETAQAAMTAYHWVMTLQGETRDGSLGSVTVDGSGNLPPEARRGDAYRSCLKVAQALIAQKSPGLFAEDPPTVLFFCLEPDELNGNAG